MWSKLYRLLLIRLGLLRMFTLFWEYDQSHFVIDVDPAFLKPTLLKSHDTIILFD